MNHLRIHRTLIVIYVITVQMADSCSQRVSSKSNTQRVSVSVERKNAHVDLLVRKRGPCLPQQIKKHPSQQQDQRHPILPDTFLFVSPICISHATEQWHIPYETHVRFTHLPFSGGALQNVLACVCFFYKYTSWHPHTLHSIVCLRRTHIHSIFKNIVRHVYGVDINVQRTSWRSFIYSPMWTRWRRMSRGCTHIVRCWTFVRKLANVTRTYHTTWNRTEPPLYVCERIVVVFGKNEREREQKSLGKQTHM